MTCSAMERGRSSGCFKSSISARPWASCSFVALSKSEENWVKTSISRYWARSIRMLPAAFFMALVWAAPPTRDTDRPTLTAGRIPSKNRSLSRKIWPSVMEITLVGIYAETSPAWVSMIGSAVIEPPPFSSLSLADRSNSRECR